MGMDADALIIVGLTVDKLDIATMPLYSEFKELVDSGEFIDSFSDLINEFYLYKDDLPKELKDLTDVKPHIDGSGDRETVIGWVIDISDDWTPTEIDLFYSLQKAQALEDKFVDIFHRFPKVYLVPRYW